MGVVLSRTKSLNIFFNVSKTGRLHPAIRRLETFEECPILAKYKEGDN